MLPVVAAVWLITGAQASGKSTVADHLARRYEHGGSTRSDLGLWLDTSEQSPEETVDEIMARADEAFVS